MVGFLTGAVLNEESVFGLVVLRVEEGEGPADESVSHVTCDESSLLPFHAPQPTPSATFYPTAPTPRRLTRALALRLSDSEPIRAKSRCTLQLSGLDSSQQ